MRGVSSRGFVSLSASSSVLAQIARPYAAALFDLATEAKSLGEIEASLNDVSDLIGNSDDFSNFLSSPAIPADVKSAAIDAIVAKAKLPDMVANFLRLIAKNGRLFALPAIMSSFRALSAKARGEISAEVTSAAPLSKAQLNALADTLKAKAGKSVTLDTRVDPSLIGGLVVKVGSQMIDTSLKTKLTAMKIAMKEVG